MKALIRIGVIALVVFFTSTSTTWAWQSDHRIQLAKKKESSEKLEEVRKAELEQLEKAKAEEKKAEAQKRTMLEKSKREALNGTEWKIELVSLVDRNKKMSDTLVFKDNQVFSRNFSSRGFPASNYTITPQEDGMVVWETMQTSETEGVLFWRGDVAIDLTAMRGILSCQFSGGKNEDYSFSSVNKGPANQEATVESIPEKEKVKEGKQNKKKS